MGLLALVASCYFHFFPGVPGHLWDDVHFPYGSPYGAAFWICHSNGVGSTPINTLAAAEQGLYCVKAFSFFFFSPTVPLASKSRLKVGKKVGGDTAGQLAQIGQRDILCHITSCSAAKNGIEEEGGEGFSLPRWPFLGDQLGMPLLVGRRDPLPLHPLFCCFPITILSFTCPNVFILTQDFSHFLFLFSPLSHWGEQVAVWVLGCWQSATRSTWLFLKPSEGWNICNCNLI